MTSSARGVSTCAAVFLTLLLIAEPTSAQVSNVDWDLQEIYEHYMGVSLAEVVLQMQPERRAFPDSPNNVVVQFNGGGPDNRLYVGEKNTLEVLIKNADELGGYTMAFRFTCYAGEFESVPGYGQIETMIGPLDSLVFLHEEAFMPSTPWYGTGTQVVAHNPPDSILVGGVDWTLANPIPAHENLVRLWSMQIYIPPGTAPQANGFRIDNMRYPPAGDWLFSPVGGGTVVPHFQGNPNSSEIDPDAPPVYFDIVEGFCYASRPRSDSLTVRIPRKNRPRVVADYNKHSAVVRDDEGNVVLRIQMVFDGDEADLKVLGVKVGWFRYGGNRMRVEFPLHLLPDVSCVRGVRRVYSSPPLEDLLNYTTAIVDAQYSVIQPTHGVTGEGVIIGILDNGVDWLHEDFTDSSGNARIKFFWGQTSQPPPQPQWFD